jgi:hypothetical protein
MDLYKKILAKKNIYAKMIIAKEKFENKFVKLSKKFLTKKYICIK